MKRISVLFLMSAVLILTSCNPAEQYKKEIHTIDSTLIAIDSLKSIFNGIDFDSLRYMRDHVLDNEKIITDFYVPGDTLSQLLGKYMNDCKSIRKKFKSIDLDEVYFSDEFNLLKHQFSDLKEDILAGVYKEDQLRVYLNTEMAAYKTVVLSFEGFTETVRVEKIRFYVASPQIDEFVSTLIPVNEVE